MEEKQQHWDNIYNYKQPNEVSWTQEVPRTSIDLIRSFNLAKTSKIIDIGGGDSKLVDFLLAEGYKNITVLDISEKALERAKKRLGSKAEMVTWIITDIVDFAPPTTYDIWHDRAAFHFLTSSDQIDTYLNTAKNAVTQYMVIGTFSENGPEKCSGLEIKQYSAENMEQTFADSFQKISCLTEDHTTPSGAKQNFLFCSFKKKQS